ncbi:hypothetical protein KVR01_000713 [Diaporthe batatas]|uniref:uncharacterized protein n=1 Tax=Diaporthe batatas TaxID=748121 RepID=UPI001D045031|nr:uncharacterized protein KVR01_000713 [Diaporthe batatas]KAG8169968.1 hypothetical protein KVR01_000713 [Diaporthe batatas]
MAASDQAESTKLPSDDKLPAPEPAHPDSLTAKCHCGRVNVQIPSLPTKLNECRCSICYRYGAEWAYYHPDDINIIVNAQGSRRAPDGTPAQTEPESVGEGRDNGLKYYVREDSEGYLGFYFCGNCGCLTHWAVTENGRKYMESRGKPGKVGVNSRMLPLTILDGVEKKTGDFCEISEWN